MVTPFESADSSVAFRKTLCLSERNVRIERAIRIGRVSFLLREDKTVLLVKKGDRVD